MHGSKTEDVANIDEQGSTGVQGRYVYQTDDTYPVRGGCSNETLTGDEMTLSLIMVLHLN